jgi:CreA protein
MEHFRDGSKKSRDHRPESSKIRIGENLHRNAMERGIDVKCCRAATGPPPQVSVWPDAAVLVETFRRFVSMFLSNLRPVLRSLQISFILVAVAPQQTAFAASDDPDLIFRKSTTFKFLTPNDKLATYAIDDPIVDGVACYYTVPEKGGISGALGLAEQVSDISLACRQYSEIKIKEKFEQGDVVFSQRRSLLFKKMQIVRGCDAKRNVLVYMVYSDKLVDGSPKNSTSTVPIAPWGAAGQAPKCADWVKG